MTVGCTCHDSLLFSKDLAWCSDTFRLVAGKDHVGNPWKSIVCMLLHASGTCLFRTDILQWKCTRSRSTSAEIQWKQDSIDLEDDEVQAISESEKGACHSWESVQFRPATMHSLPHSSFWTVGRNMEKLYWLKHANVTHGSKTWTGCSVYHSISSLVQRPRDHGSAEWTCN